jgi:hypothetical protein
MKEQKKEYWQDKASNIVVIGGVSIIIIIISVLSSNNRNIEYISNNSQQSINTDSNYSSNNNTNTNQSQRNSQELSGTFGDDTWSISLTYTEDNFTYIGYNKKTGDSLTLRNPNISGNNERKIYTWRNGNYRYQIAWQPHDRNYIRILVYDSNNKVILDRLLKHEVLSR